MDAGPTQHGLESTVVALDQGRIRVLRRGPVTTEKLSEYAEIESNSKSEVIQSPGQLAIHYAPVTPLRIIPRCSDHAFDPNAKVGLLAWDRPPKGHPFAEVRLLSSAADPVEAAANLFRYMRELDGANLDLIMAEEVPEAGLGAAIMDRLRRAAARR